MFRPIELWIGLRYTRAKRRNHFISFISATSMIGIALGVTALITVLSVMNGFEKELRTRILGMASHASVSAWQGALGDWEEALGIAKAHPRVVGAAPFVQAEGMVSLGGRVSGTLVRGVLPELEPQVSEVGSKMILGRLDALRRGEFGIILGVELANILGAQPGDKVTIVTPQAAVTPAGVLPRLKRFTVVGVFEIGMYEYDRSLVLLHAEDAARLYDLGNGMSGVRLKLADLFEAPVVSRELGAEYMEKFGGHVRVTDWTRQHSNFFAAVRTEKRVMFIILSLIVAVAAFNIVSTLVMVVTDKQADIAILRTLGLSPRSVLQVFMVQGTLVGVVGTLLGTLGGVLLALNVETLVPLIERTFGIQFLSPDVYYISDLPSDLRPLDVVRVAAVSFALSVVATLYPAWRAGRTQPAEALRYE